MTHIACFLFTQRWRLTGLGIYSENNTKFSDLISKGLIHFLYFSSFFSPPTPIPTISSNQNQPAKFLLTGHIPALNTIPENRLGRSFIASSAPPTRHKSSVNLGSSQTSTVKMRDRSSPRKPRPSSVATSMPSFVQVEMGTPKSSRSKSTDRHVRGEIIFNPIALRKSKIVYNFGLAECTRVKEFSFYKILILQTSIEKKKQFAGGSVWFYAYIHTDEMIEV